MINDRKAIKLEAFKMEKREQLYEGKAKKVFATEDPHIRASNLQHRRDLHMFFRQLPVENPAIALPVFS